MTFYLLKWWNDIIGMYDEIKCKFPCPYCRHKSDKGLQTKDGGKSLSAYKIGDVFPLSKYNKSFKDMEGYYIAHVLGVCPRCKMWVKGTMRISPKTMKIHHIDIDEYFKYLEKPIVVKR
jgi:hypothetical protein